MVLVEFDGLLELVAQDGLVGRVGAAGDEAVVIEQLAQFLGAAAMIAGELDSPVADLRHRGQRAGQVGLALLAHRVELQADGDLLARGGLGHGCDAEAEGDAEAPTAPRNSRRVRAEDKARFIM